MSVGILHSRSGGMESGDDIALNGAAMPLSPAAQKSLTKWLVMLASNDFGDLPSIVATDAIFHSPVGLKPYPGRDLVCLLLRTASTVFEDFKYHRKCVNGENAVLEFSAHIGELHLKGIHLINFNLAGQFADIEKMVRPAEAAMALGNAMGAKIGPQVRAMRDANARSS